MKQFQMQHRCCFSSQLPSAPSGVAVLESGLIVTNTNILGNRYKRSRGRANRVSTYKQPSGLEYEDQNTANNPNHSETSSRTTLASFKKLHCQTQHVIFHTSCPAVKRQYKGNRGNRERLLGAPKQHLERR